MPDFEFYIMRSNVRLQIQRKSCMDEYRRIMINNLFNTNEEYIKGCEANLSLFNSNAQTADLQLPGIVANDQSLSGTPFDKDWS